MGGYVPVSTQRATTSTIAGGGIEVVIPAKTNWFIALFLLIWLFMWAQGEWSVARSLLHPTAELAKSQPSLFLAVWLIGWTCGGIFATFTLLWTLLGCERFRVARDEASLRYEVLGIGYTRRYDPRAVSRLRAVEGGEAPFGSLALRLPWSWPPGPLAFDYGAKTIRFGAGLDHAEAAQLVQKVIATVPLLNSER